jgi:DNA (cytosine-5)-methyltransferase 1
MLGLPPLTGIEWDAAACATRAAAGHSTVRADISRFPVAQLAGRISGLGGSPPCKPFSNAGKRGGIGIMEILAALTGDMFAGRKTMAARRREMARALAAAYWPDHRLPRAARMAKVWTAVREASLVAEPARFIAACHPEWVALEQVPAVLPLWKVYAAELTRMGYSAWCGKLNAADYGVPQTRERAILIASRVRRVSRPVPTHYDPRKGDQLWGTPWVSMAEALGWGATGRAAPTVTAGGTATGGAEPFGHRDRDALTAEMDAGRWTVRTSFGTPGADGGHHEMDPAVRPAHVVTTKAKDWVLRMGNQPHAATRPAPAPAIAFGHNAVSMRWVKPVPGWVHGRPATSVLGDPRIGRPGHKGRKLGGESHFAVDSVRITVEEAAILQSFRPGYPWQGTKTKQFEQVGNAFPPLLAAHVLAMATGASLGAIREAA